jgi:hypothetical protein
VGWAKDPLVESEEGVSTSVDEQPEKIIELAMSKTSHLMMEVCRKEPPNPSTKNSNSSSTY